MAFGLQAQTTFNYTGSIQTYTVPGGVTSVVIDASGAQGGGSNGGAGGFGARMVGTFVVTPGQVLSVVVGQQGLLQVGGNAQNSSGGGGGSFVFAAGPTLLVAAGGGGGKCNYSGSFPLHADAAGQVTTNGGASSDGNAGGTAGAGGNAGLWSAVPCAGGGAGWLSNGGGPYGGMGYNTWTGGPGFCGGGGGGCGGVGGWGGGGGGGNHYGGGGGGGGYSGGGGGTDPTHGGGGGSYNAGTSQSNTVGSRAGDGVVTITPAFSPCPSPSPAMAFPSEICAGASSDLSAISVGNDINWWTAAVGGTLLGTSPSGANFNVAPTATTTYYAEAVSAPPGSQGFSFTGSIQTFTVPAGVTSIDIDARGAQGGGSNGGAGGLGAQMTGTYAVTPGQVLSVVVGQQGLLQVGGNAQNSSGGGGGTFVFDAAGPTLLVAAGGGGGKCNFSGSVPLHADAAGQVTTNGGASSDGNAGGTAGAGGNAGLWSAVPCAGGGTGWLSNGGGPYGGLGFNTWTGGPGFCGGGGGGCGGVGGWGGGGGGGNHYGGGGGGGGYSGGGGGTDPTHGGGGGSFSSGTSQSNTAGFQAGDGGVTITWGGTGCTASTRTAVTVTVNPIPTATNVTATPSTICEGDTALLNATTAGSNIDWFTTPTGGASIGTSASGADFAVTPTGTTTYYAEAITHFSLSQTFDYSGSIQTFTVPAGVTSISIDASGAQGGGSNGGAGGLGAQMTGTFAVTPGQVLSVIVGQQGLLQVGGNAQNSSGGGGGTFVFDGSGPTLLVAAGGGGGKCNYSGSVPLHADAAGQITANGGASSDGNPGGIAGAGGPAGLFSALECSGGGTGWLSAGGGPYGGLGYNTWTGGTGFCGGGGGGCGGVGGWGGGGGGGNHYGGGGGGGGYSGGGGGTDPTHGGGGGSFSIGTNQANTAGFKSGDGQVIISWDAAGCVATSRVPVTVTVLPTPVPTFTQSGNSLTSTQTWSSYQWLLNGNNIPGATSISFSITQSGTYSLMVTNADGCVGVSTSSVITGVADQMGTWADLSIFPNPTRNEFRLRTASPIAYGITVNVTDMYGKRVLTQALPELGREVAFDIKSLAAGSYMVEVTSEIGQRRVFRLVVN